jgi:hypothetical protein
LNHRFEVLFHCADWKSPKSVVRAELENHYRRAAIENVIDPSQATRGRLA